MKTKQWEILLDMDGLLCDFFTSAIALLNRETGKSLAHSDLGGVSDLEIAYGISKSKFWRVIESDPQFWWSLDPYPWANELLEYLRAYGSVTISSSPSRDSRCHSQKIDWLIYHLDVCPDDVMLGGKKYLMANANHVLIDDFEKNVTAFRDRGGHAILA